MAPTVPFALLGVVQLTAVAAWLALAAATALPAMRRRRGWLTSAGALCLAAADAAVPVQFGTPSSNLVADLRIAGLAVVALAAIAGGTTARRRYLDPRTAPAAGVSSAVPLVPVVPVLAAGIVTPLGASPEPSYVAAGLAVIAAAVTFGRGLARPSDGRGATARACSRPAPPIARSRPGCRSASC